MSAVPHDPELLRLAANITATHVSHNAVSVDGVSDLIRSVYAALSSAGAENPAVDKPQPAVPVRKSVFPDYIICLEDGRKLKMLKRHLLSAYGLTPEAYRERWGLPDDYPMIAPNYAAVRSTLAKAIGLGAQASSARGAVLPGDPARSGGRSGKEGDRLMVPRARACAVTYFPAILSFCVKTTGADRAPLDAPISNLPRPVDRPILPLGLRHTPPPPREPWGVSHPDHQAAGGAYRSGCRARGTPVRGAPARVPADRQHLPARPDTLRPGRLRRGRRPAA